MVFLCGFFNPPTGHPLFAEKAYPSWDALIRCKEQPQAGVTSLMVGVSLFCLEENGWRQFAQRSVFWLRCQEMNQFYTN